MLTSVCNRTKVPDARTLWPLMRGVRCRKNRSKDDTYRINSSFCHCICFAKHRTGAGQHFRPYAIGAVRQEVRCPCYARSMYRANRSYNSSGIWRVCNLSNFHRRFHRIEGSRCDVPGVFGLAGVSGISEKSGCTGIEFTFEQCLVSSRHYHEHH